GQALLAHHARHGVLADAPPGLAQRGGDPRRPVLALTAGEQPRGLGLEPLPARGPRRQLPGPPLVEPGLAYSHPPPGHRVRHALRLPLGGDEPGHGYRPIASLTQRATLRLSTSRSIRSSAFSFRSRTSSARSSSLSCPSPPSRRRRSTCTQFPSVPSLTP